MHTPAESGGLDLEAISAVSWDVDGTLYSTRRLWGRVLADACGSSLRGHAARSVRELAQLRRFRARMERGRAAGGIEQSSERDIAGRLALERRWLAPAIARIGARDATGELLRFLRMRVPCQVVVTDFEAEYKLASLGLSDEFDAVYVGERVGALKPSPLLFQTVLRDLEIPPQRLLHIGNRPETDGAGARAASCQVLVLGHDFLSFRQLLRILSEGLGGPGRQSARS